MISIKLCIKTFSVTAFLLCSDDIPNNLEFLVSDESTMKRVTELKSIIHPIYLGWLVKDDPQAIKKEKRY